MGVIMTTNENKEVFVLSNGDVQIRSSINSDIESYIRWNTVETEWLKQDSPWDDHQSDPDEIRERITRIMSRPKPDVWRRLQICVEEQVHIGSVSEYIKEIDGEERRYIGIFIGEKDYWGRGIGEKALKLWLSYLFNVTLDLSIYCGTWSGNIGMVKLADRCGFFEIERKKDLRQVNGKNYDGLAFKLDKAKFVENNRQLMQNVQERITNQGEPIYEDKKIISVFSRK